MHNRICGMVRVPGAALAKKEGVDPGSGCLQNLSLSGGFTSGKPFLAWAGPEGISDGEAFRKALAAIEAEGTAGIHPDERTGYIAAETPVTAGDALRATLRRQGSGMTSSKAVGAGMRARSPMPPACEQAY